MLHIDNQASEQSGSKLDFLMLLIQTKIPWRCEEPFWTVLPPFGQTWSRTTSQCYISNVKPLSQVVLKKHKFEHFYVFLWFEPRTHWSRDILDQRATI